MAAPSLIVNDLPLNLTPAEKKTVDSFIARPQTAVFMGRFMAPPKKPMKPNQEIILILGNYRALFIYAGGKIANEGHLFDLMELDTPTPKDVTFKFRFWQQTLLSTNKIPEITAHVQQFYTKNFPGMVSSLGNGAAPADVGPCGGFTTTYRCLSDYLDTPVREDIAYDVEVFYQPSNIHDLNLNEWPETPNPLQSKALIASLKYNDWFTALVAKGPVVKIGNEGIVTVTDILQTNRKIERLELASVGSHEAWITNEIWMTFALNNYLTNVSLSNNPIEDKGCTALCTHWLSTVSHPIYTLNLDKCDIGFKGIHLLFRTLRENKWVSKNLKTLSITHNKIEDSAGEMVLFLREASSLTKLEVSYTNPNWSALKSAATAPEFAKQSPPKQLTRLGLAGNKIPRPEIFSDIAAFLSNVAPALTDLDLSATSLPLSPFPTRALFAAIPNLVKLELADNEFGEDGIHTLVDILTGSDPQPLLKLKTLTLDRNITMLDRGPAAKRHLKGHGIKAITTLVSQKSNLLCPIDTLKFAASANTRLRYEILPFISALSANETITDLDITGHYAGDDLAIALGRMLQVNHTLRALYIDENQLSVMGLEFIALGLKRNFTLTRMPIPVLDISDQLKLADNQAGMQQLRERLRLPTDTTNANLQARSSQVVGEIQTYVSANNVRTFHETLKSKAAARKTTRLQQGIQAQPQEQDLQ